MGMLTLTEHLMVNKTIPVEKFVDRDSNLYDKIKRITWCGCLKPENANVTSVINEEIRYEEIHLFEIVIVSREDLFDISKSIFGKVKYPSIVEYKIDDVTVIATCPFNAGKIDYSNNINKRIRLSHYLREDHLSNLAKQQIKSINDALKESGTLEDIYIMINSAVARYQLGGISRTQVDWLIEDLIGRTPEKEKCEIRRLCVPYKYHAPLSKKGKYNRNVSKNYTLTHDLEEVWFCFMSNQKTRGAIENRKYRDIEDLMCDIDNKYTEVEVSVWFC